MLHNGCFMDVEYVYQQCVNEPVEDFQRMGSWVWNGHVLTDHTSVTTV